MTMVGVANRPMTAYPTAGGGIGVNSCIARSSAVTSFSVYSIPFSAKNLFAA